MKLILAAVSGVVLSLGLATSARPNEPRATTLVDSSGRAAFERLKTLVGEWDAPMSHGEVMKDIFRPIGAGTAILHEEWKNGEQLTATVFYLVGAELHADHFCDYGNQLRYVATPSNDPDVVTFQLRDATNLDTHPRHFHSTSWRFVDATHLTQDWEVMGADKPANVVRLEFSKVK